jgi:hypothetical protein
MQHDSGCHRDVQGINAGCHANGDSSLADFDQRTLESVSFAAEEDCQSRRAISRSQRNGILVQHRRPGLDAEFFAQLSQIG